MGSMAPSAVTATPCGLCPNFQWRCCYLWRRPAHYQDPRRTIKKSWSLDSHLIKEETKKSAFHAVFKNWQIIKNKHPFSEINCSVALEKIQNGRGSESLLRDMVYRKMTYELTDNVAKSVCHFCRPIFCISLLLQNQKSTTPCKQHNGRCKERSC